MNYFVNMRENVPEETEIVFEVLDIHDPYTVQGLGCIDEGPRTDRRQEVAETYARLCTESNRHPLPTDKKLAT